MSEVCSRYAVEKSVGRCDVSVLVQSSPEDVYSARNMHGVSNAINKKPVNSEWKGRGNRRSERGEEVSTVIRQGGSGAGMEDM